VNVTKDNFIEQSNDLIAHLPSATFIAIDEEMTGISLPGQGRPRRDEPPDQTYAELKKVPERYSIIQLGISLFEKVPEEEDEDGEIPAQNEDEFERKEWRVRRYNFYTFADKDSDRDVVMSPSAVAFLNRFNMSFDKWVKEGIPNTTCPEFLYELDLYTAKQVKDDLEANEEPKAPTLQQAARRVELRRSEDIEFFSRCMASLREWLDSPMPRVDPGVSEGTCFLLPSCNSFMRRAFYEAIQQEYPSLVLENAGPDNPNQIRVWRLDEQEKKRRDERLRRERWENMIVNKVGLGRVFLALSYACRGIPPNRRSVLFAPSIDNVDWTQHPSSADHQPTAHKIPIVVHNGFMDICFLLTHFMDPILPVTLPELKVKIGYCFPVIYDTKVMASECSPSNHTFNSTLGNLYDRNAHLTNRMEVVSIGGANVPMDQEHEAAYDAYMTGVCFIGMANELMGPEFFSTSSHEADIYRNLLGRNKLFQMSMYTMDLENLESDPMSRGMLPEATYRVSGFDPAVTTRDIIRCLSNLTDDADRTVQFEIIWVDDTTFLAAAHHRDGMVGRGANHEEEQAALKIIHEHGKIVRGALMGRFGTEMVQPLLEYMAKVKAEEQKEENPSILSRVARYFGFGKRKQSTDVDTDAEPAAKKRRFN